MFDFHEKRKIRRIIFSKTVIGMLFALTILLSFSVFERYTISREMQKKLDDRYAELNALTLRAQTLQTKVKYLGDERGVEEELRSRFDVAKQGEQVVILLDPKQSRKATTSANYEDNPADTHTAKQTLFGWFKFW